MLSGLHTNTVCPASCNPVASGRWYEPVASIPTRTDPPEAARWARQAAIPDGVLGKRRTSVPRARSRSEEHTSELQSRLHLVCRLLLEKKKKDKIRRAHV